MRILLDYGVDPNKPGGSYGTALQAAACCVKPTDILLLLIECGALVNNPDGVSDGHYGSALQTACDKRNADVTQLLLERAAKVNAPAGGVHRHAIIDVAANGHASLVELLVALGADVNVCSGGGSSGDLHAANAPLIVWAGYCHISTIIAFLLEHVTAVVSRSSDGTTLPIAAARMLNSDGVALLQARRADLHAANVLGTAMHAAAIQSSGNMCALLLGAGAQTDVNHAGGQLGTPLQAAALRDALDGAPLLLIAGATVDRCGSKFGTALQAAASVGDASWVALLLDRDADVDLCDGGACRCAPVSAHVARLQRAGERGRHGHARHGAACSGVCRLLRVPVRLAHGGG